MKPYLDMTIQLFARDPYGQALVVEIRFADGWATQQEITMDGLPSTLGAIVREAIIKHDTAARSLLREESQRSRRQFMLQLELEKSILALTEKAAVREAMARVAKVAPLPEPKNLSSKDQFFADYGLEVKLEEVQVPFKVDEPKMPFFNFVVSDVVRAEKLERAPVKPPKKERKNVPLGERGIPSRKITLE